MLPDQTTDTDGWACGTCVTARAQAGFFSCCSITVVPILPPLLSSQPPPPTVNPPNPSLVFVQGSFIHGP